MIGSVWFHLSRSLKEVVMIQISITPRLSEWIKLNMLKIPMTGVVHVALAFMQRLSKDTYAYRSVYPRSVFVRTCEFEYESKRNVRGHFKCSPSTEITNTLSNRQWIPITTHNKNNNNTKETESNPEYPMISHFLSSRHPIWPRIILIIIHIFKRWKKGKRFELYFVIEKLLLISDI